MIKLVLIASFLFSLNGFSQEIECQYAPSNDFTGTCEAFYSSGELRSQTDFVNALRHGNHIEYYENGKTAASCTFNKERYISEAIRYSENGVIIFKMVLDSTETGSFIHYGENGKLILATGQFKNSYRDGVWRFYDENGALIETQEHDSDETREDIKRNRTETAIIVPAEETIDELFLEQYGMPKEILPETIVDEPDVYAEYPKGISKMQEFIMTNVQYPESARIKGDQGKVYVSFIVELDGRRTGVRIVRGVCSSLDAEAIRLVKSMPNWKPAVYQGQNVRSKVYLPINFTLN